MPKKKRNFILIPPLGKRVHQIRIRLSLVIGFVVFLLIGFAGYLLPLDRSNFNLSEKRHQKKNLAKQNKELLTRIFEMRKMLNSVRDEVGFLEEKKREVLNYSGIGTNKEVSHDSPPKEKIATFGLGEIYSILQRNEKFSAKVREKLQDNPDFFSSQPILLPVVNDPIISVRFGKTLDPFSGKIKQHSGIDFIASRETPVVATGNGRVIKTENDKKWGKRIYIQHNNNTVSIYAHLGAILTKRGKQVKRGQVIGRIGLSGLSSGPHLHYEIRKNHIPVNPEDYIYPDLHGEIKHIVKYTEYHD